MDMLTIENLWVSIDGKEVLKGLNLRIPPGETHILFGRNGSGKSTLIMTLMGFERYRVERGGIRFRGEDITQLPTFERARLGLGIAFQRPPPSEAHPRRRFGGQRFEDPQASRRR